MGTWVCEPSLAQWAGGRAVGGLCEHSPFMAAEAPRSVCAYRSSESTVDFRISEF